ncbi:MAG: hypothetical protein WCI27_00830 [Candidatus Omnitrophota bacterium]
MCGASGVSWRTAGHNMNRMLWSWLTAGFIQAGLVAIGILLRGIHYIENRSFWQDELCLALSIVNRSFLETFQNFILFPDFAQAPLLFQLISKTFVSILGNTEMALRFFPFITGITAIFLARRFFNRILTPAAATLALAIFALGEPLVYFSAELKPYGVDVFAALLVYEMFFYLRDSWTRRSFALFVVGGALVIWLSNAMLFILAGAGFVFGLDHVRRQEWGKVKQLAFAYGIWIVSFFILYKTSLGAMLNPDLVKNWRLAGGFSPDPVLTWGWCLWVGKAFLSMFRSPLGLGWPLLMAAFFIAGCRLFWRRDRLILWLLTAPLILTLGAGAFDKYPFFERLVLFLLPGVLVIFAEGVCAAAFAGIWQGRVWGAVIVMAAVLWYPVSVAAWQSVHPRGNEDNRAAMQFLTDNYRTGDIVAISPQAQYPFWYYSQRMGLTQRLPMHPAGMTGEQVTPVIQLFPNIVAEAGQEMLALRQTVSVYDAAGYYRSFRLAGRSSTPLFIPAASPALLKGMGRVWVFLSHHNDARYPLFVDQVFARAGERLAYFERPGVSVALYDIPAADRKK